MHENIEKMDIKYKNDLFMINDFDCDTQYYPFYLARIQAIKETLIESLRKKWGEDIPVMTLHEIADKERIFNSKDQSYESDSVVIIGTLFKKMPSQPSILQELSEDKPIMPLQERDCYISPEDTLLLQDGDETIQLSGDISVDSHCTGICLALKGNNIINTGFHVQDICYASIYKPVESIPRSIPERDQYIAIVSGLGFSKFMNQNKELTNALNILVDVLKGNSKLSESKIISHLIIAGNCIGINARKQEFESLLDAKIPDWNRKTSSQTLRAVKLLDKFVEVLGQTVTIDIMPGDLDPSSQMLPQQPLHPCLFSKAYNFASIKCVTNPHSAVYNGVNVLGTSGQNIKSIQEFTSLTDPIDIMRKTLEWQHIAPTTPDCLFCYPFTQYDPFVITQYPDIYFAGNQQEFSFGTYDAPNGQKVRLISVPVFENKMVCVLVNMKYLNCQILALN